MGKELKDIIIVDTDILIDSAMKINDAVDCLDAIEQRSELAISVITQMELFVGCRNKSEIKKVDNFLKRFQIIKMNENICDKAVKLIHQYRLSHGLLISDALIAATAIIRDESFISKNQRDYRFINELKLLAYH